MSVIDSLFQLRRDYTKGKFDETTASDSPFEQFKIWFQDAMDAGLTEPNAMIVSTVSKENKPSSRVLLIKKVDDKGFAFFTNYESRKGMEIENNPSGSILFYWDKVERQVRIEGRIEKVTPEESDEYFQTRPYESRLGAWASKQSQILTSRFKLLKEVAIIMSKYPVHVPLPPFWGGYRLVPEYFEFWQGRESRLHDRIVYEKINNSWNKMRLYP